MTFRRRLAIVVSVAWIGVVFASYALEEGHGELPWELIVVQSVFPVAVVWGFWWLIKGWRVERRNP